VIDPLLTIKYKTAGRLLKPRPGNKFQAFRPQEVLELRVPIGGIAQPKAGAIARAWYRKRGLQSQQLLCPAGRRNDVVHPQIFHHLPVVIHGVTDRDGR